MIGSAMSSFRTPSMYGTPKKLIRQSRERRMFLFELYLVFSKEVKDSNGKAKYLYKMKMLTSDIGITEHVEGDECKFAVWTGHYNGKNQPASESKVRLEFFGDSQSSSCSLDVAEAILLPDI